MVEGKELKKCKYCSKEVKDVYWKNICQDCANKLSYWKRLGKEGRFKWFLKNDKAKCELLEKVKKHKETYENHKYYKGKDVSLVINELSNLIEWIEKKKKELKSNA